MAESRQRSATPDSTGAATGTQGAEQAATGTGAETGRGPGPETETGRGPGPETATEPAADVEPGAGRAPPDVSIVIPCYDEAGTIGGCVREARAALERYGYVGEVIVSDNGSKDDSVEEAASAGATVVRQPIPGYGAACLRGFERARGRFIVLVDGDGTYDLDVLNRFVEPLRSGYDMVLGTRRNGRIMPGAMGATHRHLLEPVQTWMLRRFFRFRVSDVRCGMRGVRREALERLDVTATGMELASEMLVEAARAGLAVVEVPVSFHPRPDGTPRRSIADGWRVARQLLMFSPTRLFLAPGLILLALGLGLELALLPGPLAIGDFNIDYHFMFVGSALAILGLQLVLLGVYAKTYALVHEGDPGDLWIRRFHLHYTLERGVALGGLLFGAGLAVNVGILSHWIAQGFGLFFAVRPAVLALTLMILGAEVVFASFFLSVLRSSGFGRV